MRKPFPIVYSRRGLEVQSPKAAYTARIQWRIQARFAHPVDRDPRTAAEFLVRDTDRLHLRRARFRIEGTVFGGFAGYVFQQDLVAGRVLDGYADLRFRPWLTLRAGQWRSIFSQERFMGSGRQQLVDVSILSREFTVDRQAGVSVFGQFGAGSRAVSGYAIEVLNGTGLNSSLGGLRRPMIVGRYHWNIFGVEPGAFAGDVNGSESPAAQVAVSGMRSSGSFTRFANGGAQLDGLGEDPGEGQPQASTGEARYRLTQLNVEFIVKYRGLSLQSENHWKRVEDRWKSANHRFRGSYVSAGYFPQRVWAAAPKPLEIAYRYAIVAPANGTGDRRREHTFGANYFLEGHDHKVSFEASRLSLQRPSEAGSAEWRYRAQYDIRF